MMANPLFKELMGWKFPAQMPKQAQCMIGNMNQAVQEFQKFKQTFRGDPKAEVENLLSSGQMTQEQFNNLKPMADKFMQMTSQMQGFFK